MVNKAGSVFGPLPSRSKTMEPFLTNRGRTPSAVISRLSGGETIDDETPNDELRSINGLGLNGSERSIPMWRLNDNPPVTGMVSFALTSTRLPLDGSPGIEPRLPRSRFKSMFLVTCLKRRYRTKVLCFERASPVKVTLRGVSGRGRLVVSILNSRARSSVFWLLHFFDESQEVLGEVHQIASR